MASREWRVVTVRHTRVGGGDLGIRLGPVGEVEGVAAGFGAVLGPLAEDGVLEGRMASGEWRMVFIRYSPFAIRFSPHIIREGLHVPGGVDQLQNAGDDEQQVGLGVGGGGEDGELPKDEKGKMGTSHFLSENPVKSDRYKATKQIACQNGGSILGKHQRHRMPHPHPRQ